MKIKGAIFDLDGTLLNSLIYWGELWQAVSRRFFGGKPFLPDEDTDLAIRTMTMKEAMTLVCRNCGVGESPEELYRLAQDLIGFSTDKDSFFCYPKKKNVVTKLLFATEILYQKHSTNRKAHS